MKEIEKIYQELITAWNNGDVAYFSDLFTDDATIIGFDGSLREEKFNIEKHLNELFTSFKPNPLVYSLKEQQQITDDVVLARSLIGIYDHDTSALIEDGVSWQTILFKKVNNIYKVQLLQNTPLQLHHEEKTKTLLTTELKVLLEKHHK